MDDASWHLLDYQRGEASGFVAHVRRGVELAAGNPRAFLIFSGGFTRTDAPSGSEAGGYRRVAEHYGWWGHPQVAARTDIEEFSRDSFENLLFSICRFRQLTDRYPHHITLVSWAFKEKRFGMHREAIRWPESRFQFDGPNNPERLQPALDAEAGAVAAYRADPYSASPAFRAKRDSRNPFGYRHPYREACPELAGLLDDKGPEIYSGDLPWLTE